MYWNHVIFTNNKNHLNVILMNHSNIGLDYRFMYGFIGLWSTDDGQVSWMKALMHPTIKQIQLLLKNNYTLHNEIHISIAQLKIFKLILKLRI